MQPAIPTISLREVTGANKPFSMMATTNLLKAIDEEAIEAFRKHERTGRPIGDNSFIEGVEKIAGRQLKLRKPGPKPKSQN